MLVYEFNKLVDNEMRAGTTIKEEVLFESLKKSFGKIAHSDIIHGNKGFVKFRIPGTIDVKQCEAGDLIIFSFNKKQIRYTLLQNKTKHKKPYYGVMPFQISVRQLYVLSHKPVVNVIGTSPYLYDKIFSSAILDSVGSVGIFYKKICLTTGNDYFDMNYMIANRLEHNSPVTISQFRKNTARVAKFKGTINKVVTKLGFDEVEALTNLVDLEFSIRHMLVGTPILFETNDNGEKDVLKFFLSKIIEGKENEINKYDEYIRDNDVYFNFRSVFEDNSITVTEEERVRYKNIKYPTIILIDNSKDL